jgi:hypothetical protein
MLPVLGDVNHKMFGHVLPQANELLTKKYYFDGYQHIWNFWWADKTCLGACGDFWNTKYLFWPNGTGLYFHNFSFPNMAIFLPFIKLGLTAIASYNLSFLLTITLSGFFMYLLALYLSKSYRAAIIAGTIYSISPYIIGHMIDGQLDHASIQFFPLLTLFMFKSYDEDNRLNPVIAGFVLFILGTNFSHLVVAMLLMSWFYIYHLWKGKNRKEFLKKILITFIAFSIPFFLFFYKNIINLDKFQVSGETRWTSEFFSTDLESLLIPTSTSYLGNKFFENTHFKYSGINSDNNSYIGIGHILFIFGSVCFRYHPKKIFWWALLIISAILVLGPKLHLGGSILLNWMPYKLMENFPIFNIFRTPSRIGLLVYLSMAIIVSFTFANLEKKSPKLSKKVFFILILIIIFDFFPMHNPTSKQYLPGAYKIIKNQANDLPILEYPFLWASGLDILEPYTPVYMYYQTEHNKPILGGYLTRLENDVYNSFKKEPVLTYFQSEEKKAKLDSNILDIIKRYSDSSLENSINNPPYKYFIVNKRYTSGAINKIESEARNKFNLIFEDTDSLLFEIK